MKRPLLASVAVTAVLAAAAALFAQHWTRNSPGRAQGAFRVGAAWLVLVDQVASGGGRSIAGHGTRLTALSVTDGAPVGKRMFDSTALCWPASEGRAWCSSEEQLLLLDLPALTTLANVAELVKPRGALAANRFFADGDGLVVVLADGSGVRVEAATLKVTDADAARANGQYSPDLDCDTGGQAPVDGGYLQLDGELQRKVTFNAHTDGAGTPIAGAPTFLPGGGGAFLRVPGSPLVLVQHQSSLASDGVAQLSRVAEDGSRTLWTAKVPGPLCQHASVVGDALIIASTEPAPRAFALDVNTGAMRWQFQY